MITHVVNLSDAWDSWNWLENRFSKAMVWHACSSYATPGLTKRIRVPVRRFQAAINARQLTRKYCRQSVVVSHGPYPTLYAGAFTQPHRVDAPHLSFAFNFATLPGGLRRMRFSRFLKRVDRFVVASSMERRLYSEYFDLDPKRFDLLLWSMQPPIEECFRQPRFGAGRYICAIGSQGRDYDTLIEAMRRLPAVDLVLVASAECLPRVQIPPNVQIMTDVPLSDAMNVLAHSVLMVLPLKDSVVPAGHITIVSALHLGKPIIATNSSGLRDYLEAGKNSILVRHHDPRQLADQIELLLNDPTLIRHLGEDGMAFARANCTEDNAVAYFRRFLVDNGFDVPRGIG